MFYGNTIPQGILPGQRAAMNHFYKRHGPKFVALKRQPVKKRRKISCKKDECRNENRVGSDDSGGSRHGSSNSSRSSSSEHGSTNDSCSSGKRTTSSSTITSSSSSKNSNNINNIWRPNRVTVATIEKRLRKRNEVAKNKQRGMLVGWRKSRNKQLSTQTLTLAD